MESLEPCNFHSASHFEEIEVQIFNHLSVFFDYTMKTTFSCFPSQFATENLQNHFSYNFLISHFGKIWLVRKALGLPPPATPHILEDAKQVLL